MGAASNTARSELEATVETFELTRSSLDQPNKYTRIIAYAWGIDGDWERQLERFAHSHTGKILKKKRMSTTRVHGEDRSVPHGSRPSHAPDEDPYVRCGGVSIHVCLGSH